ncbi:MAG: CrcB family protein [Muribaculaceae bacterium]|nr:CrcB family protein [Muribaculaceae bacterium]
MAGGAFDYTQLPAWLRILIVGVSGGAGAICRYLIMLATRTTGDLQGFGTLVVNVIACFLIGIFGGILVVVPWGSAQKTAFALMTMTGFCGGFSTLSAFTLDCVKYYEAGQIFIWIVFATLTIFVSLFGCAVGYYIGQKF